jgi:uncharacterized RDD family membrane protein YckC
VASDLPTEGLNMLSENIPSTWRRLSANLLDEVIMLPFYIPFFGIAFKLFTSDDDVRISLFTFILILMIPAFYEFIFLVLMQATPGKWLLGLKVVPAEDMDDRLEWERSLLRALGKRLSLFLSSALYALGLFRYDRTHAVDWLAETRVIQFSPRSKAPTIRWIIGSLLTVYFCIEGLRAAREVFKSVEWDTQKVNLTQIFESYNPESEED